MRKMMQVVAVAIMFAIGASNAHAKDVRIEPGAVISFSLKKRGGLQEVIGALVGMIRYRGWRCDSISSVWKAAVGRKITVRCNNYAYAYEFRDRGGHWVVTLK